jgi:dihydrofolate reductase
MRKITVGCLVSLDGVTADPQSWATAYFDEDAAQRSLAKLEAADAMLMGRGAYEYFQPAWSVAEGPYMDRINAIRKYVFSSTLDAVDWSNAEPVRGDAVETVKRLEGDLVVYGYTRLAQALLAHDLVDELDFWIHPVMLGQMKPLQLVATEQRPTGVVSIKVIPDA